MWAYIQNYRVVEVSDFGGHNLPGVKIDLGANPQGVASGWWYDAAKFSATPPTGPSANDFKVADVKQQLAVLDTKLERRDEELWRYLIAIGAVQNTPIPPPDYIKQVLADKDAARSALQDLGG